MLWGTPGWPCILRQTQPPQRPHSGLPIRAKTGHRTSPAKLLAPGLVGARQNHFWVYFRLKPARGRRSKKKTVFFTAKGPIFGRFSPNLDLRRPKCRENYARPRLGPLSGHFSGGKFWYHGEKKLAHFWGLRGAFGHFFGHVPPLFFYKIFPTRSVSPSKST